MYKNKFLIRILAIILMMQFSILAIYATHNRAGEITYVQKGPFIYEITLVTYTYTLAPADRPTLDIYFGDGSSASVRRVNGPLSNGIPFGEELADNYKKNIYVVTHTYPGPGTYVIMMQDQNRNEGVLNIPNSVNIMFAVKSILQINPNLASNSAPVMLNPPIDKAARGQVFIHNPNAFDPDGDSLSYKLTVCLGDNGLAIPSYTYPPARNSLQVDPRTGDLIWDYPETLGIYNVAMEIEEWRNGVKIGKITRDMQIEVIETDNRPPVIDPMPDMCVTADSLVQFDVRAHDAATESVTLSSTGGVYLLNSSPAQFTQQTGLQNVSSTFSWQTNCSHVRKLPYLVIFKATDNNPEQALSSYKNVNITVVAPAPKNLLLQPMNNAVWVKWDSSICSEAAGYKIYRKNRPTGFVPDHCELGVPESLGYKLVGTVSGWRTNEFYDDGGGVGLNQGFLYCYLVTAYFDDGAESYASEEACAELTKGVPIIIQATVSTTDPVNGAVHLSWMKPIDFDTIANPPPYRYSIFRSNDLIGTHFIDPVNIDGIDNTFFNDTICNTLENPRLFLMGLYNYNATGQIWTLIGVPSRAASPFLSLKPGDNKVALELGLNVPWENYQYEIYRKAATEPDFGLVATTDSKNYTDIGLTNGIEYCYKVKTIGEYGLDEMPKPIINFSQEACVTPIDTFPPCPPIFTALNNCDSSWNDLNWTNPNLSCADDVVKYNIYFTDNLNSPYQLITTINDPNITTFRHVPTNSLAGCYIVTAIDSFNNESSKSNIVCADNCLYYSLPNTFTPDGNGINDLFKPFPYQMVDRIDIKIYSRWGNLVYQTNDPDINWDGKNMMTKQAVAPGVYYYVCDVWEYRLTGLEIRNLTGFIHVFVGGTTNGGN